MRILFLSYKFPASGEEADDALYCLLSEYAQNSEIQADFVTTSDDGEAHAFKLGENVTIYRLPIRKNSENRPFQSRLEVFRYAWKTYKFCKTLAKTNSYDLTHSFSIVPCAIVAYLLKRKFKIPYVIALESQDVDGFDKKIVSLRKKLDSIIKKVWEEACFYVASSQRMAKLMLVSKPEREIEVIYNGIDTKEFFPDPAKKDANNFTVICVSDLVPEKGLRFLIRAFNILVKRYGHLRLIIVGDGSEKSALEDLVFVLGLKKLVTFTGSVPQNKLLEYYQKANIFVHPSIEENLNSKTMLEAMACGLPLLATKNCRNSELIEDGKSGFIIKGNESHDLCEKIEQFILNKNLEPEMSRKSRELAEKIDWSAIADKYFEIYEKTISLRKIKQGS